MNYKALSDLHKLNNPFSLFTVIMAIIGLGQTAGAAAIFIFGILPAIQGIHEFEFIVVPFFLVFGAAGVGLLYYVINQIVKYLRCFTILKSGNNGTGTYIGREQIYINREQFYRIKYSFKDDNNIQHEVKSRYIYSDHDTQELHQMGTFPVKFQGKHSVITWIYEPPVEEAAEGDTDNVNECIVMRIKRVVFTMNMVFGITIFAAIFAMIMKQGSGEISNNDALDTVLIITFVVCLVGGILTNVVAGVIRKLLFVKTAVQDIKTQVLNR